MEDRKYRLVVKWRGGYCNLPVTRIEKNECIVWAYNGDEFIGMFDLGAVDFLYKTEMNQPT